MVDRGMVGNSERAFGFDRAFAVDKRHEHNCADFYLSESRLGTTSLFKLVPSVPSSW